MTTIQYHATHTKNKFNKHKINEHKKNNKKSRRIDSLTTKVTHNSTHFQYNHETCKVT